MSRQTVIAGDWGTSHLRLFRLHDGKVVDRRKGPGIGGLTASAEATFLGLTEDWRAGGDHRVVLCGMVGSRSGWREAPYRPCPAKLHAIASKPFKFERAGLQIAIAPGLSCENPLGGPDVMRGEETKVLGALRMEPALASGRRVVITPGTHSKWVEVEDGTVVRFQTSMTGELFAVLRRHSSLGWAGPDQEPNSPEAFSAGLQRAMGRSPHVLQLLFETRTRQLIEGLSPGEAMAFLSGLLIGTEVDSALDLFGRPTEVAVVGATVLTELYMQAFAARGLASRILDGEAAVLAGLSAMIAGTHAAD